MIKAAIFDMDGLLIDSEPLWDAVNKKAGISYSPEERQHLLGRGARWVIENWHHKHPQEGTTADELVERVINDFTQLFRQKGALKPGAHKTLEICRKNGLSTAIASSSPLDLIHSVVDQLDIRSYFDEFYSGENEPYGKPHPGIFITAAHTLDVIPENCLVFEDAPSGVLAAKAAKMKCIAVPERAVKFNPFIQTADIVINSLEKFDEAMLKKLETL